jgi:predicted component of viral defense system (DUF524 family)
MEIVKKLEFRSRITKEQQAIIKEISKNTVLTPFQCSRIIQIIIEKPDDIEKITKTYREFLTNIRNELSDIIDTNDLETYTQTLAHVATEIKKQK